MDKAKVAFGDTDIAALEPRFLNRDDATRYLLRVFGIDYRASTLKRFDVLGVGPGARTIGRTTVYAIDALDRWAESRMRPIKEPAGRPPTEGRVDS
jgi:hypothetical protein